MSLEPINIAPYRMFGDLPDELHGLGFVARFARVVRRNDHLDLKGDDEAASSN
jgi:hypothetical protein